jgi:hypothetical protein
MTATRWVCVSLIAAPALWLGAEIQLGGPDHPPALPVPAAVQTPAPDPGLTPVPTSEPTPGPTAEPDVITQIFKVVFSAESLSEALAKALESVAEQERAQIEAQIAKVKALLLEIMQPPAQAYFAGIAASVLSTAAALAPALFLVRLVQYHWNRLVGEDDTLLRVFGDWLAAGFLAVSAGPFLDAVVLAGWWAATAALGETEALAAQFTAVTSVTESLHNLTDAGRASMLAALFWILGGLGGLLGVLGLAASFAVAQAALFVMATVAPVVAVLAVVPEMRWLRGLWLKAAAVLALMPVAAGGIFKAGVILSYYFGGGGLSELLVRLFWLWGAAGFMLSLAGILGRVTLSTAVESTVKFGKGVGKVVAATAGARSRRSGAAPKKTVAAEKSGLESPSTPGAVTTASAGGTQAPQYVRNRPAVGNPASGRRAQASTAAERAEASVSIVGHASLAPYFRAAGLDPAEIGESHPEEMDALAGAFASHPETIAASPDPLAEAARLAGADRIAEALRRVPGTGNVS